MGQIHNDSTKRPQIKENQLGISKISAREFMHFAGNSAEGLGSRRGHCWGYISMRIHPKSFCTVLLKVVAILLSGLREGTVGAQ